MREMQTMQNRPIGVFDSGLGGLTVVRQLREVLPDENIVYFGDLARLPYGTKSKEQIIDFSDKNVEFLLQQNVKAVIIACNSSASSAAAYLKRKFDLPIIDVISATVRDAIGKTHRNRIGVLGTAATIESGVYQKQIKRLLPDVTVITQECPLFVSLVEEGWLTNDVAYAAAERYLKQMKRAKPDVVILGCTHYPLLKKVIGDVLGSRVTLIESAPSTVAVVSQLLERKNLLRGTGKGKLDVMVSDKSRNFIEIGSRFLGKKMTSVRIVKW